jgi:CMP-N,N'-diacetyllegionaminic acid synthase
MSECGGVLAVVGARAGSRGLPGKNVAPFAGHPLLAWIVSAARRAATIDRVIVSTDSDEYATIARQYGAEVPVLRPPELATDEAVDAGYIAHLLDWLRSHEGYEPEVVLRLLPTVPMQAPEDLDAVVHILREDTDATAAMVVAEARQHPAKALRVVPDAAGRARLTGYATSDEGAEPTARQSYDRAYFRANVVATRPATVRRTGTLAGERVAVHVIEQARAIDIDTAEDLAVAELVLARQDPPIAPPVPI